MSFDADVKTDDDVNKVVCTIYTLATLAKTKWNVRFVLSLYLSFVFLFELPPTMKIHIFIYRKVSLRIELVVSHLISSHLMRIVLFSFQQNLFRPGCVYRYRGRKRTRNEEEKTHTRTEQKWLCLRRMCDKGRNWKKIWIREFTTWSYFKCYRVLVGSEKVSLSV